jgi:hypothetical protein
MFFDGVCYYITDTLPVEQRAFLREILKENGAEAAVELSDATHIITKSKEFDGRDSARQDACIVTVRYVHFSINRRLKYCYLERLGRTICYLRENDAVCKNCILITHLIIHSCWYSPESFSPDPSKLFSGVIACATEVRCSLYPLKSVVYSSRSSMVLYFMNRTAFRERCY